MISLAVCFFKTVCSFLQGYSFVFPLIHSGFSTEFCLEALVPDVIRLYSFSEINGLDLSMSCAWLWEVPQRLKQSKASFH